MSARPQPVPVRVDDLDLLISRSLDGDLGPEEERQLALVLASDPAARQRRGAMEALVGRLEALPEPETPFALATRVSAQVDEETRGLSASLHRFGLFPGKGAIGVAVGVLVVIAIGATLLNPPDVPSLPAPAIAEKADDGPVQVFFQERTAAKAEQGSRPAEAAPEAAKEQSAAASRPANEKGGVLSERPDDRPVAVASPAAVIASVDRFAPEPGASRETLETGGGSGPAAAAPRGEPLEADAASGAEAYALERPAKAAASAPEPPARLAASAPTEERTRRPEAPTRIEVLSGGGWQVVPPARIDGLPDRFTAVFRLSLDARGHVTGAAQLSGDAAPSGISEQLSRLRVRSDAEVATPRSVEIRLDRP